MQNIVHSLNTNHKTMILIRNLILPTSKPSSTPNILRLQCRKNLRQTTISFKSRCRISMREFTMIHGHDFIVGEEESSVDRSCDGIGNQVLLVDGFHGGF